MLDALVLGLGKMGLIHLAAYQWLAERGLIGRVFVHDTNPAQVEAALQRWPNAATAWNPLKAPTRPWCASVCVPAAAHVSASLPLLALNPEALLIEKPLALTVSEADVLLACAGPTQLFTGHSERFNVNLQAPSLREGLCGPRRVLSVWRQSPPPRQPLDVVRDLMIHDIDLALLWFGLGVQRIQAGRANPHSAYVKLTWQGGDTAQLWANAEAGPPLTRLLQLTNAAKGSARIDLTPSPKRPPDAVSAQLCSVLARCIPGASATLRALCAEHPWDAATGQEGRAALLVAERILGALNQPELNPERLPQGAAVPT